MAISVQICLKQGGDVKGVTVGRTPNLLKLVEDVKAFRGERWGETSQHLLRCPFHKQVLIDNCFVRGDC